MNCVPSLLKQKKLCLALRKGQMPFVTGCPKPSELLVHILDKFIKNS
jgi:hypothetical protein